jgi:hypothetical protein
LEIIFVLCEQYCLFACWGVASCSVVDIYLCFRAAYCLHHQSSHLHCHHCENFTFYKYCLLFTEFNCIQNVCDMRQL